MNLRKSMLFFGGVLIFSALCVFSSGAAQAGLTSKYVWGTYPGGGRTVTAVYVDLKDPTYRVEAVWAKGAVSKTDRLANIAASAKTAAATPVAAINGTYFNLSNNEPQGTIRSAGEFDFVNTGSVMMFDTEGGMDVSRLFYSVTGSINGASTYPHNWEAYSVNRKLLANGNPTNILYTPDFGTVTNQNYGTSVVCDRYGKVVQIVQGSAPIIKDGFTILFYKTGHEKRFKVSDIVAYEVTASMGLVSPTGLKRGGVFDITPYRTMLGAARLLLRNGYVVVNAKGENTTESAVKTIRARRGFVGITKDNVLILGTVNDITVNHLAYIARSLGCVDAACTDGGTSTGLWVNGAYRTTPGRNVANALVVTKLSSEPVDVTVNSVPVHFKNAPYRYYNSTMAPVRELARRCEISVTHDEASGTVTMRRGKIEIQLYVNSTSVKSGDTYSDLPAPMVMKNGELYMTVDALTFFGGNSGYNASTKTDNIQMASLNTRVLMDEALAASAAGNTTLADQKLRAVLRINPDHSAASYELGILYERQFRYREAARCFLTALQVFNNDTQYFLALERNIKRLTERAEFVQPLYDLVEKNKNSAYMNALLGDCYAADDVAKYDKAAEFYRNASRLEKDAVKKKEYYDSFLKYEKYLPAPAETLPGTSEPIA